MTNFIEIIKAVFYGIVEGITEWLPVSSTGHLILFEKFFGFNLSDSFIEMFRVVIQLGAILAVILLFWNKLFPWTGKKTAAEKKQTYRLWIMVIVACLPAAVIGLLFDDLLDRVFYNFPTVAITLILYGIAFIVIENLNKKGKICESLTSIDKMPIKTAFLIGVFQLLSLIPGTSRSGSTILGAMILGCSRVVSAEFSFFLAIPVMIGASLLKVMKFGMDIAAGEAVISSNEILVLIVGMVVAFIVSLLCIRFLMNFIKRHDFKVFGWYRIALGAVLLIYFASTVLLK